MVCNNDLLLRILVMNGNLEGKKKVPYEEDGNSAAPQWASLPCGC